MRNVWDHVIDPREEELRVLDEVTLANLAIDVVEATMSLFEPGFREFFPKEHADLVLSAVQNRAEHARDWQSNVEFPGQFLARYNALPKVPVRPSVGPFMMALVRLFEALQNSLDKGEVMEILSACYESILMSQLAGRFTYEDEAGNAKCQEMLNIQNAIIDAYVGIRPS